jgi:hypothetical protein
MPVTEQKPQSISVNLSLEEIQGIMCEDCKKRLRELIVRKAVEQLVR